ncbi:DnaD domain-containing protein [Lysinibacillus piscis]|uniref:DnaB/C C-terminal domain-containing protein n=1 Tax=Lysinibacillus piscis TaxID=2518931 RepID=A0ABQ5NHE0_9BACI|nr:DnaD domain protein [Lysinibacillus sp. KH24]GLC87517.1 hypothetical protein LYSBPC_06440 [Lysinibacillus sp. KH24]
MNNEQQNAERMRVKQILQRGKQDIEKIFMRMEQELCADISEPAPIFAEIEKRFGRPFSGVELQIISDWIDKYTSDLIIAALNEATVRNVQNIKYIDKILFNWEKAGITDAKAAIEYTQKFGQRASPQQPVPQSQESNPAVPFYNWLEERE